MSQDQQRRKARIIGPFQYVDALGDKRELNPGPCEIGRAELSRKIRLYVRTKEGVELSYDVEPYYLQRCLDTNVLAYEE